jgi:hypothetical protein
MGSRSRTTDLHWKIVMNIKVIMLILMRAANIFTKVLSLLSFAAEVTRWIMASIDSFVMLVAKSKRMSSAKLKTSPLSICLTSQFGNPDLPSLEGGHE